MKRRRGSEKHERDGSGTAGEAAPGPEAGSGPEGVDAQGDAIDAQPESLSEAIREELRELDELRDRHLRVVAEFENYRKRTRRELGEARQMGQGDIALALLEVLDDLSRFAAIPADQTTTEVLHEGVELVNRKLRKKLEDAGLKDVDAGDGVVFNPAVHEALLTAHVDDPALDDRISRVFSPGYLFGERLLRPAQVEVQQHPGGGGGAPDPEASSETGADGAA
jgi:molecular chaperone GrpE